jgi:hypothetical protein
VAVGSVRPKANARALQKLEVDAAREAAQVVQAEVVGGLMQSGLSADPLRALLDGASPDDLKALRREINARRKPAATGIDPDLELAAAGARAITPTRTCSRAAATRSRSTACRWSC